MALTNLSQITTSGIATGTDLNIRNITGVAATFTGNVTVGGTLTYDDVTNIDSVGLITARSGINVTGGDVNLTSGNLALASATPMVVASNGSGHLRLGAGGSEKVRIKSDGKVGIGTDNPRSTLDIISPQFDTSGNINASTVDQNSGLLLRYDGGHAPGDAGAGIRFAQRWYDGSNHNIVTAGIFGYKRNGNGNFGGGLKIATSSGTASNLSTRITIDDSGKVGINDVTPVTKLVVRDTLQAAASNHYSFIVKGDDNGTNGESAYIFLSAIDASTRGVAIGAELQSTANNHDLVFKTSETSATPTEKLRITSTGNIGIGATVPDVYSLGGNNRYAAIKASTGYTVLNLVDSNNSGSYLQFGNPTVRRGSLHFDSSSNFLVTINESGSGTNLTEKLRLDLNGRLTISGQGLKLNPTASSLYTLDGSLSYYATNNAVYLNGAGTNGWLRLNASGAENNQNAINIFGGGAGAYIGMRTSNIDRFRITSSGNIGIGTVTPTHTLSSFGSGNSGGVRIENTHSTTTVSGNTASTAFPHNLLLTNYESQVAGSANRMASLGFDIPTPSGVHANATIAFQATNTSGNGDLQFWIEQNNTPLERLRITSTGGVLVGGHTSPVDSGNQPNIEIVNTSTSTLTLARNDTSIASGNDIAAIRVWGNDSNGTYQQCAEILAEADGDHATDDKPTALVFKVTADGASSPTERLRIRSDGRIAIGTQTINTDSMLSIHRSSSDQSQIRFTNTTTGEGGNNGLIVGIDNNEHGRIFNVENHPLRFGTNNTERVRIDSSGRVLISGQAALNSTSLTHSLQVACSSDADGIAIIGRADDIGELSFYEADKTTNLGEIQYRQDHANFRHRVGDLRFASGGVTERLRINSAGAVNIGGNYTQTAYVAQITGDLLIQKNYAAYQHPQIELYNYNTGAYGGAIKFTGNLNGTKYTQATIRTYGGGNTSDGSLAFFTGSGTEKLHISSGGRIGINANPTTYANTDSALGLLIRNGASGNDHVYLDLQNEASESGRIRFIDGDNGIGGQIYFSHNTTRDSVGGNCMGFFTGNNILRFQVTTSGANVHGSTDGVLNLDTTDGRGSFIRFQQNGSTKVWVGCAEGMGGGTSSPDQDDLGLRATGNILFSANGAERLRITEDGGIIKGSTNSATSSQVIQTFFNKRGSCKGKRVHQGASSGSTSHDLLTINSWQSGNTRFFAYVTVHYVNPISNLGGRMETYAGATQAGSRAVGTFAVADGGRWGTPGGTMSLSWSGNTLELNTFNNAYMEYSVDITYVAYDGASVTFNTN